MKVQKGLSAARMYKKDNFCTSKVQYVLMHHFTLAFRNQSDINLSKMDRTFHEIQAKVAKRLIHSDRHRRRKSIAPELVTCNSKNHDLSRLQVKNEILFKNLEAQMSTLQNQHRRRQNELLRSEKALTGSVPKRSLPHLSSKSCAQNAQHRRKSQTLEKPRRKSLIDDELSSSSSSNELVQRWLQSFDIKSPGRHSLQVPSFFDLEEETSKSACLKENAKSGFVSEVNNSDLETNHAVEDGQSGLSTKNNSRYKSESKVGSFKGKTFTTNDKSKINGGIASDGLLPSTSVFIETGEVNLEDNSRTLTKTRISDVENSGDSIKEKR